MIITKKSEANRHFLARIWNEFLFAREFEYESPLTPDEMATALKAIEKLEHHSWVLSVTKLEHKLALNRQSDKQIEFKITLDEDKDSKWSSKMTMLYSEGSINANPDTGMSIIKGRTRFSGQYYALWIFLFSANIFTQVSGDMGWGSWLWVGFAVLFWLAMYQSRNALADKLDTIIMHAKSESSIAILDDKDNEDLEAAATVIEAQRLRESE